VFSFFFVRFNLLVATKLTAPEIL